MRQQQLESRNLLLEKCSNLTNRQTPEQLSGVSVAVVGLNFLLPFCGLTQVLFLQDGPYERLYIAHETDASENGPSVTISVRGGRQKMTVQEMSVMPVAEFALLWTVRSHQDPKSGLTHKAAVIIISQDTVSTMLWADGPVMCTGIAAAHPHYTCSDQLHIWSCPNYAVCCHPCTQYGLRLCHMLLRPYQTG